MPTTGSCQHDCTGRTVEAGVAVGEDAAVGGHQPVAVPVRRAGHAHHRLVEGEVAGRAVEAGVAVGEDAAVGGHQPVAAAVGVEAMPTTGLLRVRLPVEP